MNTDKCFKKENHLNYIDVKPDDHSNVTISKTSMENIDPDIDVELMR